MSQKASVEKADADLLWENYHVAINDLASFEQQKDVKKKEIITRIRDQVEQLVELQLIQIKKTQISVYVMNKLEERNITISKSWYSEIFPSNLKRNYSKSSQPNFHEHEWSIIIDNSEVGTWEVCKCGANSINGIIQTDDEKEVEEKVFPSPTAPPNEIIESDSVAFDILRAEKQYCQNLAALIDLILQKCSVNMTAIKNSLKNEAELRIQERIEKSKLLANKRIQIVINEYSNNPEAKLKELQQLITEQMRAKKKLNDRKKITRYEKVMAKLACSLGYHKNNVASILNITTKHIKNEILADVNPSSGGQNTLLEEFGWFGRCPNTDCGIVLKDFYDEQIENYRKGTPIDDEFELEPLLSTGYAKELILAKEEIKKLKRKRDA